MSNVIGIDEAGRGPIAGPVAVGVVRIQEKGRNFFKGIKDSKQLSREDRELWFGLAVEAKKKGELDFSISLVSEKIIDKHGISYAIRLGIKRCLNKIKAGEEDQIFLDGSLKAPGNFKHQKTVIRGDEKIAVISLASIMAKVTRDKYMVRLSKKYPKYGFDVHKGYGTLSHRQSIKKHGSIEAHRKSFIKNLI